MTDAAFDYEVDRVAKNLAQTLAPERTDVGINALLGLAATSITDLIKSDKHKETAAVLMFDIAVRVSQDVGIPRAMLDSILNQSPMSKK